MNFKNFLVLSWSNQRPLSILLRNIISVYNVTNFESTNINFKLFKYLYILFSILTLRTTIVHIGGTIISDSNALKSLLMCGKNKIQNDKIQK